MCSINQMNLSDEIKWDSRIFLGSFLSIILQLFFSSNSAPVSISICVSFSVFPRIIQKVSVMTILKWWLVFPIFLISVSTSSPVLIKFLRQSIQNSLRNIVGPRRFSSNVIEVDKLAEKSVIEDEYSMHSIQDLKSRLLHISALTNRGEFIQEKQQAVALSLIEAIERRNIIPSPASSKEVQGSWNLVYSNTYLFRSSPFFMAARAVCKDGIEAERFNFFCKLHREALGFTSIGNVKQIVSDDGLRSEFETRVAALPGLPLTIRGTIVSTADIISKSTNEWTLFLDKVRIMEGTSNIPVLRTFLNQFEGLNSRRLGSLLESTITSYSNPKPIFRTNFVDESMRISRDQDDNVFVYTRA